MPSSPNSVVIPDRGMTDSLTPIRLEHQMEKQLKIPLRAFRSQVLVQAAIFGKLCGIFADMIDDSDMAYRREIAAPLMGELMKEIMVTARTLGINLANACDMKMDLNIKKYPAELCKGNAAKYTEYSGETGITKTSGQDVASCVTNDPSSWFHSFASEALPRLWNRARQFAIDREFVQYHTPRSILLAEVGEQGELSEVLQFHGDDDTSEKALLDMDTLGELTKEIADVAIYLFRLADVCKVDLRVELERQLGSTQQQQQLQGSGQNYPVRQRLLSPNSNVIPNMPLEYHKNNRRKIPLRAFRSQILVQASVVGKLCGIFAEVVDDSDISYITEIAASPMGELMKEVMVTARGLGINLANACDMKIDLNIKKYPVELCKGNAAKYTEYSGETGITKTSGQDVASCLTNDPTTWFQAFASEALPRLSDRARQFVVDRNFVQYHTPRNLALALVGEQGELSEVLQFHGDDDTSAKAFLDMETLGKLTQEIADVAIYLLRLADVCGVDLRSELERQLVLVEAEA